VTPAVHAIPPASERSRSIVPATRADFPFVGRAGAAVSTVSTCLLTGNTTLSDSGMLGATCKCDAASPSGWVIVGARHKSFACFDLWRCALTVRADGTTSRTGHCRAGATWQYRAPPSGRVNAITNFCYCLNIANGSTLRRAILRAYQTSAHSAGPRSRTERAAMTKEK
jgi:hypothetical protein